ncbi:NTF2-like protein [Terfezia boudieri ATCC MYA-4762]|uniref:NTF2-like protein n=1 Tax=Terfezia boudieri ATCC MYA-4762 TaxID=1051890 RepID=A0A3N4MD27_9PEZI|nr:NTF2-like protein [Terfezia boudieri ATCC MYA-4762]
MPNAAAPSGPRGQRGARGPRRGGPSRGGISKRSGPRGIKTDKDGDLDMDAPVRQTPYSRGGSAPSSRGDARGGRLTRGSGSGGIRGGTTRSHARGSGLVEITVLGWQESQGNRDSVIDFLERKTNVRIKKSRTQGDALIISVPFLQVAEIVKWDGCRYAGSTLSINAQNVPKITSKGDEDVIMAANPRPSEKSDTIKVLEQVLAQRYNSATKMLDLSRLGEDATLRQNGFFDFASTTSKMFPALMLVADRKFDSAAEKRDAVVSVTLGYNNLKDIKVVSCLAATFSDLKNLSLEGNMIPSWASLDSWRHKFRKLEQLVLSGNPIVTEDGYKEEAMRRYPMLQMLDNVVLDRPVIKIGAAQAIPSGIMPTATHTSSYGSTKTQLPLGVKPGFNLDDSGVGMQFLSSFFTMYDNNRDELLATFYDEASRFSVSANTMAPRTHQVGVSIPPKPWEPYYQTSRNMMRTYAASLITKLFIGTQKIRDAWQSLPRSKHDVSDSKLWVFDIWPVQGLPDVNNPSNLEGVGGLIATVHGEYEEVAEGGKVPLKRSFDRTFTLAPGRGAMNLRVVNDMMVVRAWGGSDAWTPEPQIFAAPVNEEEAMRQAKIVELRRRTGLNAAYAELCMIETGWNWDGAYAAFERAKADNLLPPEAFI